MGARNHSVDIIKEIAEDLGVTLEFKKGGRHWKVFLDNRMIMILPQGNPKNQGRAMLNNIAQLRRAVEGRGKGEDGRHK